ncbi:MAG: hypothetical protein KC996_11085 [Phycisphaerales bacterium]|nr:hypothetical protein [Phycisphaerales bacterium]
MDNVKPWQIILMVLAVGALAFSIWKFVLTPKIKLPTEVYLVDVSNGELFIFDISGKAKGYYPERSPDSQNLVLMPVTKDENGKWFISGHSLPALQDVTGTTEAVINASTGEVRVDDSKSPRKFKK